MTNSGLVGSYDIWAADKQVGSVVTYNIQHVQVPRRLHGSLASHGNANRACL